MPKLRPIKEWSKTRKWLLGSIGTLALFFLIGGAWLFARHLKGERLTQDAQALGVYVTVHQNWLVRQPQFLFGIPSSTETVFYVGKTDSFDNRHLQQLRKIIEEFPQPVRLCLEDCKQVTDLTALKNCQNIEAFASLDNPQLTDYSPIGTISNIEYLNIQNSPHVTDWTFIENLTELEHLQLSKTSNITNLDFAKNLTELISITVTDSPHLTDVSALTNCRELTNVNLAGCTELKEVNKLFHNTTPLTGYLSLQRTSVPNEQILKLVKQFPDCIFSYDKK